MARVWYVATATCRAGRLTGLKSNPLEDMTKPDLYRSVAELHIKNINQGFLSTLGTGFVALMYQAIDECDDSVLLVRHVNGTVVGFVAGSSGMGPIYRRMLRHWVRLFWTLLPSVFSYRRIRRIVEILRYSRSSVGDTLPVAELLSIAVDPLFRGQGHAERLYGELSENFRLQGVSAFKIVVGSALEPAQKFYKRMGAHVAAQVTVHDGAASVVYVQPLHDAVQAA